LLSWANWMGTLVQLNILLFWWRYTNVI
jgi:hypothetical protein